MPLYNNFKCLMCAYFEMFAHRCVAFFQRKVMKKIFCTPFTVPSFRLIFLSYMPYNKEIINNLLKFSE